MFKLLKKLDDFNNCPCYLFSDSKGNESSMYCMDCGAWLSKEVEQGGILHWSFYDYMYCDEELDNLVREYNNEK